MSRPCPEWHAQVAELVDALASGASGRKVVKVRVLSWAPITRFGDGVPLHEGGKLRGEAGQQLLRLFEHRLELFLDRQPDRANQERRAGDK